MLPGQGRPTTTAVEFHSEASEDNAPVLSSSDPQLIATELD